MVFKFCFRIYAFLCRIQHALFFVATSADAAGRGNAASIIVIGGFIISQTGLVTAIQGTLPLGVSPR